MLKIKLLLLIFYSLFLFLLVLYIPLDHLLIKANSVHKIAPCPKMIPPIGLLFQCRITLEKLDGNLSFQYAHQLRDRYLGRHRYQQMNMIFLHVELFYNAAFPFTKHSDVLLHQLFYGPFQDTKPVLGHPDDVVVALIDYVTCFPVFAHPTKIGIASSTSPPAKQVDF